METKSYAGCLRGKILLGGQNYHESSRFESKSDAEHWLAVIREANERAGRRIMDSWIQTYRKPHEIADSSRPPASR